MADHYAGQHRPYYDVFISYRHRDSEKANELEKRIINLGHFPFLEKNFGEFDDRRDVTKRKVEILRTHLSKATCLIFAYSRKSADTAEEHNDPIGVWMPWELGFFDGSVSGRIGVYLLDGPPNDFGSPNFNAQEYFRGSEYLQVYEILSDGNLGDFLARNAVRERRIDNVASAFIWMRNLLEESLVNPLNVGLGIAEWYADHLGRHCNSFGYPAAGALFDTLKVQLDDLRVGWSPLFRWKLGSAVLGHPLPAGKNGDHLFVMFPGLTQLSDRHNEYLKDVDIDSCSYGPPPSTHIPKVNRKVVQLVDEITKDATKRDEVYIKELSDAVGKESDFLEFEKQLRSIKYPPEDK